MIDIDDLTAEELEIELEKLDQQLKKKDAHKIAMKKYFQSEKGKTALKKASKKYYLKKKTTIKE